MVAGHLSTYVAQVGLHHRVEREPSLLPEDRRVPLRRPRHHDRRRICGPGTKPGCAPDKHRQDEHHRSTQVKLSVPQMLECCDSVRSCPSPVLPPARAFAGPAPRSALAGPVLAPGPVVAPTAELADAVQVGVHLDLVRAAVGDHRDAHGRAHRAHILVVRRVPRSVGNVPRVHRDRRHAGRLDGARKRDRRVDVFQQPNLARHRHAADADQRRQDLRRRGRGEGARGGRAGVRVTGRGLASSVVDRFVRIPGCTASEPSTSVTLAGCESSAAPIPPCEQSRTSVVLRH